MKKKKKKKVTLEATFDKVILKNYMRKYLIEDIKIILLEIN